MASRANSLDLPLGIGYKHMCSYRFYEIGSVTDEFMSCNCNLAARHGQYIQRRQKCCSR